MRVRERRRFARAASSVPLQAMRGKGCEINGLAIVRTIIKPQSLLFTNLPTVRGAEAFSRHVRIEALVEVVLTHSV